MFFRLVTSVGQRKNSNSPQGTESQTFGFRAALPLSHRDSMVREANYEVDCSERGIRKSEVRFLMGTQNFLSDARDKATKHLSLLYLYIVK